MARERSKLEVEFEFSFGFPPDNATNSEPRPAANEPKVIPTWLSSEVQNVPLRIPQITALIHRFY